MVATPLPVIARNGFRYFLHPDGRTSAAISTKDGRLYARDFPVSDVPSDDRPQEPSDFDFVTALSDRRTR